MNIKNRALKALRALPRRFVRVYNGRDVQASQYAVTPDHSVIIGCPKCGHRTQVSSEFVVREDPLSVLGYVCCHFCRVSFGSYKNQQV